MTEISSSTPEVFFVLPTRGPKAKEEKPKASAPRHPNAPNQLTGAGTRPTYHRNMHYIDPRKKEVKRILGRGSGRGMPRCPGRKAAPKKRAAGGGTGRSGRGVMEG